MSWKTVHWQIPVGNKPEVRQIALSIHGRVLVERFRLQQFWCLHLYQYHGELRIDDHAFPIRPGYVGITPPNALVEYRYRGKSPHYYAHFALPGTFLDAVPVAAMQDLGKEFGEMNRLMKQAIEYFPTQPLRSELRVWDILLRLAGGAMPTVSGQSQHHPFVQKAMHLIEMSLQEPIYISELARETGVSQTHLLRLFRAELGTTIVGYIQNRRLQRARHLLEHSTRPIKTIAHEVGIADLHLFNKMLRRVHGVAPRQVRKGLAARPDALIRDSPASRKSRGKRAAHPSVPPKVR